MKDVVPKEHYRSLILWKIANEPVVKRLFRDNKEVLQPHPMGKYLCKVNNKGAKTRCMDVVLVSLLLSFNKYLLHKKNEFFH